MKHRKVNAWRQIGRITSENQARGSILFDMDATVSQRDTTLKAGSVTRGSGGMLCWTGAADYPHGVLVYAKGNETISM